MNNEILATNWKKSNLVLVGSRDGRDGSLTIHQDVSLYWGKLTDKAPALEFSIAAGRAAWLQMMRGELSLNDSQLAAGDAASLSDVAKFKISSDSMAEFLLFDLS